MNGDEPVTVGMRGLTFELSRRQRLHGPWKMNNCRQPLALGLERGVRRRALNEAPGERGVQKVPSKMHVTKRSARINPARAVERR